MSLNEDELFALLTDPKLIERERGFSKLTDACRLDKIDKISLLSRVSKIAIDALAPKCTIQPETLHGCWICMKILLENGTTLDEPSLILNCGLRSLLTVDSRLRAPIAECLARICLVSPVCLPEIWGFFEEHACHSAECGEPSEVQVASMLVPFRTFCTAVRALPPSSIRDECTDVWCTHSNNHIREQGFFILSAYSTKLPEGFDSRILRRGLSDSSPQVRFAASAAVRGFLMGLESWEAREPHLPNLIPPLCLNRYLQAVEGVRIFCQETWKMVFEDKGKGYVEKYISSVVEFYVEQVASDHVAVREAACLAINEVCTKLSKAVTVDCVHNLLACILRSLSDSAWNIRCTAATVLGNMVHARHAEIEIQKNSIFVALCERLGDHVWVVREDAAVALGKNTSFFGHELLCEKCEESMRRSMNPLRFATVEPSADVPLEHQQDNRNPSDCQCADSSHSQPWEMADGAVYLVRELSRAHVGVPPSIIRAMLKLTAMTPSCLLLSDTIWKQLPEIFRLRGKAESKEFLSEVLHSLSESIRRSPSSDLESEHHCIVGLGKLFGNSLILSRTEHEHARDKIEKLLATPLQKNRHVCTDECRHGNQGVA
eukprot:ANDGO_05496.mRNA.1 hypothetical protein PTSG_07596